MIDNMDPITMVDQIQIQNRLVHIDESYSQTHINQDTFESQSNGTFREVDRETALKNEVLAML